MKFLNKNKYYILLAIIIIIIIVIGIFIYYNNYNVKLKLMKLSEYYVDYNHFITTDKIYDHHKSINNNKIRYIKTDFIKNRDNNDIIHIEKWNREEDTYDINTNNLHVIITGHSDYDISNNELPIINKDNIIKWFSVNMNIRNPKCISIPLGITNKNEIGSKTHKIIGNYDKIYNISRLTKPDKNLAYLNINVHTFPEERNKVYNTYKNKHWVTLDEPKVSLDGHESYLNNIYSHKFIFAPRGNGIDTHRIWESLYLRSIPIVKKCIGMEQFYDLPILFVDNWDNITEEYLHNKYDEIMSKNYPLYKLNIDYWKNMISNVKLKY